MSGLERDFWRTRNGRRTGVVAFVLAPGDITTAVTDGERPATVIAALDPAGVAAPGLAVSVLFADRRSPEGIEVNVEDGAGLRRLIELGPIGKCLVEDLLPGPVRCAVGGHVAMAQSTDPLVRDLLARPVAEGWFDNVVSALGDVQAAMVEILAEHHAGETVVGAGPIEGHLQWAVAKGTGGGASTPDVGVRLDGAVRGSLGEDVRVSIRRDESTCTVSLHDLPAGLSPGVRVFVAVSGPGAVELSLGALTPEGDALVATVHWPHDEAPDAVTFAVLRD